MPVQRPIHHESLRATYRVPLSIERFRHPILNNLTSMSVLGLDTALGSTSAFQYCETERGSNVCSCGKFSVEWVAPGSRGITLVQNESAPTSQGFDLPPSIIREISNYVDRSLMERFNEERATWRAAITLTSYYDETQVHDCPICVEPCRCREFYLDHFCNHVCKD